MLELKRKGRKPRLTDEQKAEALALCETYSVVSVAKQYNISARLLYKYIADHKNKGIR
nr:transposase [Moritella viscosa]SHO01222.1 Resolvase domain [Moritella viscosa]